MHGLIAFLKNTTGYLCNSLMLNLGCKKKTQFFMTNRFFCYFYPQITLRHVFTIIPLKQTESLIVQTGTGWSSINRHGSRKAIQIVLGLLVLVEETFCYQRQLKSTRFRTLLNFRTNELH